MPLVTKTRIGDVARTLFVVDPDTNIANTWDATDNIGSIGQLAEDERVYEYRLVAVHKPTNHFIREEIK